LTGVSNPSDGEKTTFRRVQSVDTAQKIPICYKHLERFK